MFAATVAPKRDAFDWGCRECLQIGCNRWTPRTDRIAMHLHLRPVPTPTHGAADILGITHPPITYPHLDHLVGWLLAAKHLDRLSLDREQQPSRYGAKRGRAARPSGPTFPTSDSVTFTVFAH